MLRLRSCELAGCKCNHECVATAVQGLVPPPVKQGVTVSQPASSHFMPCQMAQDAAVLGILRRLVASGHGLEKRSGGAAAAAALLALRWRRHRQVQEKTLGDQFRFFLACTSSPHQSWLRPQETRPAGFELCLPLSQPCDTTQRWQCDAAHCCRSQGRLLAAALCAPATREAPAPGRRPGLPQHPPCSSDRETRPGSGAGG